MSGAPSRPGAKYARQLRTGLLLVRRTWVQLNSRTIYVVITFVNPRTIKHGTELSVCSVHEMQKRNAGDAELFDEEADTTRDAKTGRKAGGNDGRLCRV